MMHQMLHWSAGASCRSNGPFAAVQLKLAAFKHEHYY